MSNYWTKKNGTINRRRVVLGTAGGGAALAAMLAVGCGDDDDESAATSAATQPAASGTQPAGGATAAPSAAAEPWKTTFKQGGTITTNLPSDPPSQDFHKSNNAYILSATVALVYSQLISQRATPGNDKLQVAPDLALSWEQPDKTTYVFKLRPDALFHDKPPVNGRKLVAGDIAYSFNRQISEKVYASSLAGVKAVTAVDDQTVRIELDSPNADFLMSVGFAANKILAKEAVEAANGNLMNGPTVGTGPFMHEKFGANSYRFVRNPKYFLPGRPVADAIEWVTMRDSAAVEAQFRTGAFTYASTLSGGLLPASALALSKEGFPMVQRKDQPTQWIMVNNERPAFKDPRVRKALSMAIDRDLVIANALEGQAGWNACSMFLPDPDWLLPDAELKKALAYNPKEAKALLAAAGGIPGGEEFLSSSSDVVVAQSQLVQANFKDAGWDAKIRVIDTTELSVAFQRDNAKWQTLLSTAVSHQGTTFTSDAEAFYRTKGPANAMKFSDAGIDALLDKQRAELDAKARKELILEFQRKFLELLPSIPLASRWTMWVGQKSVKNVVPFTNSYSWIADIAANG